MKTPISNFFSSNPIPWKVAPERRRIPGKQAFGGFTLVEIALALGIFAFAILPVIGLMGTGLKVSQDSIFSSTRARILEQVSPIVRGQTGNADGSANFTLNGQVTTDAAQTIYTAHWTDSSTSQSSSALGGLLANKVWKVTIGRTGVTSSVLATNFVMFSKDPKDL